MARISRWLAPMVVALALTGGAPAQEPAVDEGPTEAEALQALGVDFWEWRIEHQPLDGDGARRLERPTGWRPEWSKATVERRLEDLARFRQRWRELAPEAPAPDRDLSTEALALWVDHQLIGSALARVEWELDVWPTWRIDPWFYVAQTEGALFDLLLEPPPFDRERSNEILVRLESVPDTIFEARRNLDLVARPFAERTMTHLAGTRGRLQATVAQLRPHLAGVDAESLYEATESAIAALEGFARWLEEALPDAVTETAVGAEAYRFYLEQVALVPWSAEELMARARQERQRAAALETIERQRHLDAPPPDLPETETLIARATDEELAVRAFLGEHDLLDVPDETGHYRALPMPAYLGRLVDLGSPEDLTSEARLGEDAVGYLVPPAAADLLPGLVHDAIPGGFLQLVLSWQHQNPLRRRFYDSTANDGIAFYAEEMLLQAGLFDGRTAGRELLYHLMRLRALEAEIDVGLATGELSITEAAAALERELPGGGTAALDQAVFFATSPGRAIGHQVGKLQVLELLSAAREAEGDSFSLRRFHDRLWKNGNVPIALQRREYPAFAHEGEGAD
jgi:hypothetical protein